MFLTGYWKSRSRSKGYFACHEFHRPDWTELIIPAGPEHLCFHHGRLEWLEQLKTNVSDDTCRMPCRGLSWHIQKRSVDMAVCLCRTYSQGFEPITEGESWWNRNSPTTTAKIQFALGWRPLEAFAGFLSDFFVGCFSLYLCLHTFAIPLPCRQLEPPTAGTE